MIILVKMGRKYFKFWKDFWIFVRLIISILSHIFSLKSITGDWTFLPAHFTNSSWLTIIHLKTVKNYDSLRKSYLWPVLKIMIVTPPLGHMFAIWAHIYDGGSFLWLHDHDLQPSSQLPARGSQIRLITVWFT